MKPQRITLIRHGQSAANVNYAIHAMVPDYRIPLTDQGGAQAKEAGACFAASLGSDRAAVYCSPFLRTRQTLQGMLTALPRKQIRFTREDPRLREQEYGHLRGPVDAKEIEAEREKYGSFYYRIPDGESGCDVYDRCTAFLDTLYRDFAKDDFPPRVLIVTHGFTLRMLITRWLHLSPEEFEAMRNPGNCEMIDLVLQANDKFRLARPFPRKSARELKRLAAIRY